MSLFREIGNPWGITTALHGLIQSILAQRKYADAQLYTEELIRLSEAIDDRAGVEWGLGYLGRASYEHGDYLTARAQLEQSLAHFQTFGLGEARLHLPYLGMTACRLGNYDQARRHLSDALRLAVTEDAGKQSVLLAETLVFCAELLADTGQLHRAVEALTAVLPVLFPDQWEYTEAEALIRELSPGLSLDEYAIAKARGEANDLKALAASLLEVLQDQSQRSVPKNDLGVRRQPWVDPLSERELEVLQLVADGLSNRAIARQLIVTVGTVKKHLNNIFSKLGVGSRTQAVKRARELHLLS